MSVELLKSMLPLGLALLTLVGGAIVYMIQKAVDRKNQILLERRELYRKFVVCFREYQAVLLLNSSEDEVAKKSIEFSSLNAELLVCAPDTVVKAMENIEVDFAEVAMRRFKHKDDDPSEAYHKTEIRLDEIVLAMRLDTFGDSKVTKTAIELLLVGLEISVGRRTL